MEITVRLLGTVNQSLAPGGTVLQRHIATVTAEQLSHLLAYDRTGQRKNDRFRLKPDSFVQIDKEIQRGRDTADNLLQMPAKVEDIASTLLGAAKKSAPHAFLGSLIWNVRNDGGNSLTPVREEALGPGASLPTYKLRINADHVWLTDSAHRHLGISEAFRRFASSPQKFPKFRKDYEFVVEIYQLDRAGEKALFFELNAMQKRITAAKRKEMDVVSSEGYVKDVVRQYDEANRRLFEDNIEVTANQNVNHTLMTMSVFVSSIHEMFLKSELNEAKELAQKRAELAEYYCDFFYKLHDTVVIAVDDPSTGKPQELTPYYNLYLDIILPAFNAVEGDVEQNLDKLDEARAAAKALNARVRGQDIANANATIKALCRVARTIRHMPNWERAIDYLQTGLNVPLGGRFFQKANAELFAAPTSPTDVQLAKLNDDGTINIQIQSQTVTALYRYLRRKLQLDMFADLLLVPGDVEDSPRTLPADGAPLIEKLSRLDGGTVNIEAVFFVAGTELSDDTPVKLAVEAKTVDWKDLKLTGTKRIVTTDIHRDESYVHPIYENNISRFVASFAVKVGAAPKGAPGTIPLEISLFAPDLDPNAHAETTRNLHLVLV